MKTTIRMGEDHRLTVSPSNNGAWLEIQIRGLFSDSWQAVMHREITPDQAGALIFGLEQAIEASETAAARVVQ